MYISLVPEENHSQKMDDPDVDHELIALLRESLGISNKAQDVVSSDTGKGGSFSSFMRVAKHIF